MTEPKRGRGRRTKREEAQEYLAEIGIDPAAVLRTAAERAEIEVPDDPEQIVEQFKRALYTQMELGELKGVALVNGLKAVATLAEEARKRVEAQHADDTPELTVDEIIRNAGLPNGRRIEVIRGELERLGVKTERLATLLTELEAA